jgi:hypothetical protein
MRAVALADAGVRKTVRDKFIPLKVTIPHGSEKFPLTWEAMEGWSGIYLLGGGKKVSGIMGCSVVTPDREHELASTGSAMVWEMFDTIAYDAKKFQSMLDAASERWAAEQAIRTDRKLSPDARAEALQQQRKAVDKARKEEGKFRLPPKGFTEQGAKELFGMTGDYQPEK